MSALKTHFEVVASYATEKEAEVAALKFSLIDKYKVFEVWEVAE